MNKRIYFNIEYDAYKFLAKKAASEGLTISDYCKLIVLFHLNLHGVQEQEKKERKEKQNF